MNPHFIGLMSGTSLDGVDGVLVELGAPPATRSLRVLGHVRTAFPSDFKLELLALNRCGFDELHRSALAGNRLANVCSQVVETLLAQTGTDGRQVVAIGCHGQTVRHRPGEFDGVGYTVQLNAPALLAELTGIDVIADFRSRDIAAGGQGAPLAPAFHRAVFARVDEAVAVLNLGGIANLTSLRADGSTVGFDCGPANALLDLWCSSRTGRSFDSGGTWAASGRVDKRLREALLSEPYFKQAAPKSTGRDRFNAEWLEARLMESSARERLSDEDIQATLAELTAQVCADACRGNAADSRELVVCGGGAFNVDLMRRLSDALAPMPVISSELRGLAPDQVEAVAFAWLAHAFVERRPGNLASVTGAAGARILGALYPAR